jgi:hypothetical protein
MWGRGNSCMLHSHSGTDEFCTIWNRNSFPDAAVSLSTKCKNCINKHSKCIHSEFIWDSFLIRNPESPLDSEFPHIPHLTWHTPLVNGLVQGKEVMDLPECSIFNLVLTRYLYMVWRGRLSGGSLPSVILITFFSLWWGISYWCNS